MKINLVAFALLLAGVTSAPVYGQDGNTESGAANAAVSANQTQQFWLGVMADRMTDEPESIVRVHQLMPQSPAAEAGLQVGDVITQFNGVPVEGLSHLGSQIQAGAGKTAQVAVQRDGETIYLAVTPQRKAATEGDSTETAPGELVPAGAATRAVRQMVVTRDSATGNEVHRVVEVRVPADDSQAAVGYDYDVQEEGGEKKIVIRLKKEGDGEAETQTRRIQLRAEATADGNVRIVEGMPATPKPNADKPAVDQELFRSIRVRFAQLETQLKRQQEQQARIVEHLKKMQEAHPEPHGEHPNPDMMAEHQHQMERAHHEIMALREELEQKERIIQEIQGQREDERRQMQERQEQEAREREMHEREQHEREMHEREAREREMQERRRAEEMHQREMQEREAREREMQEREMQERRRVEEMHEREMQERRRMEEMHLSEMREREMQERERDGRRPEEGRDRPPRGEGRPDHDALEPMMDRVREQMDRQQDQINQMQQQLRRISGSMDQFQSRVQDQLRAMNQATRSNQGRDGRTSDVRSDRPPVDRPQTNRPRVAQPQGGFPLGNPLNTDQPRERRQPNRPQPESDRPQRRQPPALDRLNAEEASKPADPAAIKAAIEEMVRRRQAIGNEGEARVRGLLDARSKERNAAARAKARELENAADRKREETRKLRARVLEQAKTDAKSKAGADAIVEAKPKADAKVSDKAVKPDQKKMPKKAEKKAKPGNDRSKDAKTKVERKKLAADQAKAKAKKPNAEKAKEQPKVILATPILPVRPPQVDAPQKDEKDND